VTQPINIIPMFVYSSRRHLTDKDLNLTKTISGIIQKYCPNLHFFDKMVFEAEFDGYIIYHFEKTL
jgi:hypothetical protein